MQQVNLHLTIQCNTIAQQVENSSLIICKNTSDHLFAVFYASPFIINAGADHKNGNVVIFPLVICHVRLKFIFHLPLFQPESTISCHCCRSCLFMIGSFYLLFFSKGRLDKISWTDDGQLLAVSTQLGK